MRKCTAGAKCLVHSGYKTDLRDAETIVRKIFDYRFPDLNFSAWDQDVTDDVAQDLIDNFARSPVIYVKQLIQVLS